MKRLAAFTNILYIKIPVFDPDRILTWMFRYLSWIFTTWFFVAQRRAHARGRSSSSRCTSTRSTPSCPAYQEFFTWNTVLYMWISLGVVKVIHEFGHGLEL